MDSKKSPGQSGQGMRKGTRSKDQVPYFVHRFSGSGMARTNTEPTK
jgi:hypothetical protein